MSNIKKREYLASSNKAPNVDKLRHAGNFIDTRIKDDKQKSELQDSLAVTQSQNVFKSLETH